MKKTDQKNNIENELKLRLHKINSQISIIWGYSQMIERKAQNSSDIEKWSQKINLECQNLAKKVEEIKKILKH